MHNRNQFPITALLGVESVALQGAIGLLLDMQSDTCTAFLERLELFFCVQGTVPQTGWPEQGNHSQQCTSSNTPGCYPDATGRIYRGPSSTSPAQNKSAQPRW